MTGREAFADDEWFRLRSAPWQVAMGVVEADPSGTLSTAKELHSVDQHLSRVWDHGSENDLVRLVAYALAEPAEKLSTGSPEAVPPSEGTMPDRVIAAMEQLRAVLDAKVDPAEAAGFCAWLVEIAGDTAEAAREGAAGLTGPRVSAHEAGFLARLRTTLGLA